MDGGEDRWISEQEAARLWRRAAELQAESARRLEERSRSLVPREETPEGYRLEHVRDAAREAGIAPEFLDLALAEGPGPEGGESRVDRISRRFLGPAPEALLASRVFDAPPARVFETLCTLLPAHPYALVLADTRGPHPLEGGVLVFDVPALTGMDNEPFAYEMTWGDVKELHVRLQPLGTRPTRCEVAIRAPLGHSRRLNLWVGGGVSAFLGVVSGGFGLLLGATVAAATALGPAAAAGATLAVGAALGAAASGGSVRGWRGLYRYAVRRSERALHKLLQQVNAQLQVGGAFAPPQPSPPPLPAVRPLPAPPGS